MKQFLEQIPRLPFSLRRYFGLGRRYSVRYNRGTLETTGFLYRKQAERWARENPLVRDFIVCDYDMALDLRIQQEKEQERSRWVG